jgi:hypothetical protein
MVGFRRLGRKALFEKACEVRLSNAHAIVLAGQLQLLAIRLVQDLSTHAQDTLLLAGIMHRLRRVDDPLTGRSPP